MSIRRGLNGQKMFSNDQGEFCGVCLGADFCAEHEWGIKDLKEVFGIKETAKAGIARRTITRVPEDILYSEKPLETSDWTGQTFRYVYLGYDYYYGSGTPKEKAKPSRHVLDEICPRAKRDGARSPFEGAWDSKSFAVGFLYPDGLEAARKLHDALLKKDFSIFFGAREFLENPGLILAINSKLDKAVLEAMKNSDQQADNIEKFTVKSKIRKLLEEKGKRYFYLGGKMIDGEIRFWLNPQEQQKYNYGWYSLEDLKLWAEDKGPVMKKT